MARLIVQDGDQRRAFRVREGKLTIGSGEGCTLRLVVTDVAEVHAELELKDGQATLVPRPGVLPPTLGGKPIQTRTVLPDGARIAIGSSELQVRYDEDEAGVPAAPGAPAGAGGIDAVARAAAAKARKPRVQSTRPLHEVKRGAPVPLVLGIVAVVLVVGIFAASRLWKQGASSFDPVALYNRAYKLHDTGNHELAEAELKKLEGAEVTPELAQRIARLKDDLANVDVERAAAQHNEKGSEYMDTQLVRFEQERLQGEPPRPAVRVFLKRCREFREEWPDHPDMEWVDRHESRFRGFVDLSKPPTFEDVEFEIKTMTWAMPRDYRTAFRLLEDFERGASSSERDQAAALRTKLNEERAEYFDDRMKQAAWLWDRDQKGQAVEWLVQLIAKVGDEAMEQEAAEELIALPGVEDTLRAYRRTRPETFEAIVRQDLVRRFASQAKLL